MKRQSSRQGLVEEDASKEKGLPHPPGVFRVRVKPNMPKNRIVSSDGEVLFVEIAAPPEKNKANVMLVKFLSRSLGAPVRLKSGASRREKTFMFLS